MSIKVKPWKGTARKFQVYVYFRWSDGSPCMDRKVVDAATEAQARKWGEQRERELREAGKPKPEQVKTEVLTVAAFAPMWVAKHAKANRHKESGVDTDDRIIRLHLVPNIGGLMLDEVTDEIIADLKSKWADAKAKSVNNRLTVLNTMLRLAVEWKRIPALPCRIRLLKVDKGQDAPFYEHDVYERLVNAAAKVDARYHAMILLGGDAGLRRGEIMGLDLADVDFAGARMAVRRNVYWKRDPSTPKGARALQVSVVNTVKGGITKWIRLTPRLLAALKACRHLRGPRALYNDEGGELTPQMLKTWVSVVERRAGLPVTGRIHIFRHTFCSHLAMAGVPAMTIKDLARHENLATTMRYMHLSPSAKDQGIEMLTKSREAGGVAVTLGATASG